MGIGPFEGEPAYIDMTHQDRANPPLNENEARHLSHMLATLHDHIQQSPGDYVMGIVDNRSNAVPGARRSMRVIMQIGSRPNRRGGSALTRPQQLPKTLVLRVLDDRRTIWTDVAIRQGDFGRVIVGPFELFTQGRYGRTLGELRMEIGDEGGEGSAGSNSE